MVMTRKNRSKRTGTRKARRSSKKAKVSRGGSSFRDRVKRILNNVTETKYVTETILDGRAGAYVNFNSTIKTGQDWYRCLPLLAQGSGGTADVTWVREGAEVVPLSQRVNWEFRFSSTDGNTRDIYVVLYVVQPVTQKSYGSVLVNGSMNFPGQFLKTGSASATYANQKAFDGVPLDTYYPIYNKNFRLLHKKVFRLARSSGSANGSGVVPAGTGMYSNTGHICKRHSWTNKSLPKKLKYSETAAITYPNNAAPYWACGYYYADGTAPDTTGGLLNVTCITDMTFKDD